MPEEGLLIRRVRHGDKKAYQKLFDGNVNQLYRFLCQFSKDKDLVEDWVQRSFIKAYYNLEKFQGNSKFSTWLFSIGINEMKTDMKKISSRKFEDIGENTLGVGENEVKDFEWSHDMKWLLSELSETWKAVFILFEVEGYSHSEIAEMMDISESTSRTILCRTKNVLKEKWSKQEVNND